MVKTITDIKVRYDDPDGENPNRRDSVWYTWDSSAHHHVATVSATYSDGEVREVRVFCDGIMRIRVYATAEDADKGGDPLGVVRYCDRLPNYGINTDSDLTERLVFDNNSWFDLYDPDLDDPWLDCVCDTLDDAIDQAKAILEG